MPWYDDFKIENGRVRVVKTGVSLSVTWALVHEIANWIIYLAIVKIVYAWRRVTRTGRQSLFFAPDRPRPWYLARGAAMWAGIDVADRQDQATASFYFDDSTLGSPPALFSNGAINAGCVNISKTYVATVFEAVFGYALSVDPRKTTGEIVEKPEQNGVHGGHIVVAPLEPRPGYTYQRVVDTCDDNGCCHDLRTPCAGGVPVVVWVKTKAAGARFSIINRRAVKALPSDIYSADELRLIKLFSDRMGLDWGGLDILRDRSDGRIYIVDVNKTDLGPVIALSWRDKISSMALLGAALKRLISRPKLGQG
jgi:hypothetical protein